MLNCNRVRSIRALAPAWPSPAVLADARPASRARSRGLQTWALVTSAFVLGLALGAAAFVGAWRVSASRGDNADSARAVAVHRLHDVKTRSAALRERLDRIKSDLSAALVQERRLSVKLKNAERQAARSSSEAARDQASLATLRQRAAKVGSDVAALEAYVRGTPNAALDSGFLLTQLQYLAAVAQRLQAS